MSRFSFIKMIARRSVFVKGFYLIAVIGIVYQVFSLQITKQAFLKSHAKMRTKRVVALPAKRGMILDRHGTPLAVSTKVRCVWIDPKNFHPTKAQLDLFSRLTEISKEAILAKKSQFQHKKVIYIRRHLDPKVALNIQKANIPGVYFESAYRRFYPAGEVNASVLGLTDVSDVGLSGLEASLDSYLRGQNGKKSILQDRLGREIELLDTNEPQLSGQNITLSLDQRLQYIAFDALKAAILKHQAQAGCAVILEVGTGEILAMVNFPTFNPNDRLRLEIGTHQDNRSATHMLEPGSTLKAFSVASALEQKHFTPNTKIDTRPGVLKVGNHRVRDLKNNGLLSIREIMRYSSNVGVAKLALALPSGALADTYMRFGFGTITESGFPGEQAGRILMPEVQHGINLASMAFGYGIAVTPLQLARAYSILGANGMDYPVSFFKTQHTPLKGQRVLSVQVAQQVREMLLEVVEKSAARRAKVFGYAVAGKTGTSRKVLNGRYSAEHHIAIFAGLAPAISPKFSIVVVLDDPKVGGYYGAEVAAPVFSKIAENALRLYNVPMDLMATQGIHVASREVKSE